MISAVVGLLVVTMLVSFVCVDLYFIFKITSITALKENVYPKMKLFLSLTLMSFQISMTLFLL